MKTRRCEVCGNTFTTPRDDDPCELCPLCREVMEPHDDT